MKEKLAYFIKYYKNHKLWFTVDFGSAFIMSLITLTFPFLTRRVIDTAIPNRNVGLLVKLCLILLGLQVLRSILRYVVIYWGHGLGLKIRQDMRSDLFAHLQKLSLSYYDNVRVGELMSRVMNDLEIISELAHHGPEDAFIAVVTIIGSFFLMYSMNPLLTIVIFILLPLFLIGGIKQNKKMKKAFRESKRTTAELSSELEDNLSGIRAIKAFGNEKFVKKKFDVKNKNVVTAILGAFHTMGVLNAGMGLFSILVKISIFLIGGKMVIDGKMSLGELVAFLTFVNYFMEPVMKILNVLEMYQNGMAGFERFINVMAIDPDIKEEKDAVGIKDVQGRITFEDVSFSYDGSESVINNFSLDIKSGENVALVGESGAGKSTICSLIPRFYDVTSGSLRIDGIEVSMLKEDTLRENIGIVQQDVFLFNGSIKENIAFGKLGATDEEIVEAARKANATEFIDKLEDKFDTYVGERGVKLSGGQKQRISIARLFLKDPKIVILDEATSALDNQTERFIQEALFNLAKGTDGKKRTLVTIAHRLSTIEKADRIIVVGKDGIIEEGSHEVLLEKQGVYERLYNSQVEGFM